MSAFKLPSHLDRFCLTPGFPMTWRGSALVCVGEGWAGFSDRTRTVTWGCSRERSDRVLAQFSDRLGLRRHQPTESHPRITRRNDLRSAADTSAGAGFLRPHVPGEAADYALYPAARTHLMLPHTHHYEAGRSKRAVHAACSSSISLDFF